MEAKHHPVRTVRDGGGREIPLSRLDARHGGEPQPEPITAEQRQRDIFGDPTQEDLHRQRGTSYRYPRRSLCGNADPVRIFLRVFGIAVIVVIAVLGITLSKG